MRIHNRVHDKICRIHICKLHKIDYRFCLHEQFFPLEWASFWSLIHTNTLPILAVTIVQFFGSKSKWTPFEEISRKTVKNNFGCSGEVAMTRKWLRCFCLLFQSMQKNNVVTPSHSKVKHHKLIPTPQTKKLINKSRIVLWRKIVKNC